MRSNGVRAMSPAKENMSCQSSAVKHGLTEEAEAHTTVGLSNTPFQLLCWYDLSFGLSFSGCPAYCRLYVLEAFTDMP